MSLFRDNRSLIFKGGLYEKINNYLIFIMFVFLFSAILLGFSFFKTKSILMKIVHAAGCICSALWCVIYATGNTILSLYMFPLMLLTGIVFVAAAVNLLWIRLKAGAAGYGWNEGSDRYYQRKRR